MTMLKKAPSPPRHRTGWTREPEFLDVASKLGEKLRELRLARGISLKEASDITGVPRPTLSRIENNKMAPTIPLLAKVVAGFKVAWAELLPESLISDAPSGARVSFSSTMTPMVRLGSREARALHPNNPLSAHIRSFIMSTQHKTVKEAGGLLGHPHTELCFVLEGILQLHFKGRRARTLQSGESALFDAEIPHAYTSKSGERVRFLLVGVKGGRSSQRSTATVND
jgi:transcriptional regulator with XRE-family HTH domain/quercetin dioxygenase-like cupin family protein